jgi:ubiquinone/menaquinone biosynthesis C-methylase UbiE
MASVQQHYDDLLAKHYTWMLGDDIERAARGQRALLDQLGIWPAESPGGSVAVDIGCGSGAQALALADMGFDTVLGVDSNAALARRALRARRPAVVGAHGPWRRPGRVG